MTSKVQIFFASIILMSGSSAFCPTGPGEQAARLDRPTQGDVYAAEEALGQCLLGEDGRGKGLEELRGLCVGAIN